MVEVINELRILENGKILCSWKKYISPQVISDTILSTFQRVNENLYSKFHNRHQINLEENLLCCENLIHYTWEQLNIGNWKDVQLDWRYFYGYLSLVKAFFLSFKNPIPCMDILKTCDMGLIMSPSLPNNFLAKFATIIHQYKIGTCDLEINFSKKLKIDLPTIKHENSIERINFPDITTFEIDYFRKSKPVIIENALNHWPALDPLSGRRWSLQYLFKTCGFRTVPVEIGSRYTGNF